MRLLLCFALAVLEEKNEERAFVKVYFSFITFRFAAVCLLRLFLSIVRLSDLRLYFS